MKETREVTNIRTRMINALRLNNRALTLERNDLINKNQLLSHELAYFQNRCVELEEEIERLTSGEAGRNFAKELLGHTMTPEEVAIEEAENGYNPYVGDDF